MLSLLNYIDPTFIITLGIILFVNGAIMLYCYRRLNLLENSIIEHGKVLQTFIINYNSQVLSNMNHSNTVTTGTTSRNSTDTMSFIGNVDNLDFTNHIDNTNISNSNSNSYTKKTDMINVSDDENNDSDLESESESDSDSDDELNNNNNNSATNTDIESSLDSDAESVDGENIKILPNQSIKIENLDLNTDERNFIDNIPMSIESLNINLDNNETIDSNGSKMINLTDNLVETQNMLDNSNGTEKKNYSKMKVDDLKALAVTKNLIDNEGIQKMKKNDVIKLLQA